MMEIIALVLLTAIILSLGALAAVMKKWPARPVADDMTVTATAAAAAPPGAAAAAGATVVPPTPTPAPVTVRGRRWRIREIFWPAFVVALVTLDVLLISGQWAKLEPSLQLALTYAAQKLHNGMTFAGISLTKESAAIAYVVCSAAMTLFAVLILWIFGRFVRRMVIVLALLAVPIYLTGAHKDIDWAALEKRLTPVESTSQPAAPAPVRAPPLPLTFTCPDFSANHVSTCKLNERQWAVMKPDRAYNFQYTYCGDTGPGGGQPLQEWEGELRKYRSPVGRGELVLKYRLIPGPGPCPSTL